jgi:acyl carrier protein
VSIETELQEFIGKQVVVDADKGDVRSDEPLVSTGRVDSMGLLQILGFIQQTYGVDLPAVGGPRDFETVASLAAAIRRARGER